MNFQTARENMIEQQVRPSNVLDQQILSTMSNVPREVFLAETFKSLAFADTCLPIGQGKKTFPPSLEGQILQALTLSNRDTVLEIGTGCGYLTACLAKLTSQVDSIDLYSELIESAQLRLQKLEIENCHLETADASKNYSKQNSYDAIVMTGSIREIPQHYKNLLAINGRMVGFIGTESQPIHTAVLMTRISSNEWVQVELFETRVEALENF